MQGGPDLVLKSLQHNEGQTAGRILKETSHLGGAQGEFGGDVGPEMGLEKLFQLDIRKGISTQRD